jgi:uncharacterized membrane protein YkvA (DUF1232 family)
VNRFVRRARERAERVAADPAKTSRIADAAASKAERRRGEIPVLEDLTTLIRMVRAFAGRDYRDIPWQSLILILGTIIYFVSPVDAVPDVVPVLGFLDDVALISLTVRSLRGDVEKFRAWEKG